MRKKERRFLFFLLMLCLLLPAALTEAEEQNPVYRNVLKRADGKTCYYNENGELVRNTWMTIGTRRYYFTAAGEAATGLKVIRNVRYLFGIGGALKTDGFYRYKGNVYYANRKGIIQTGWKKIGENRYFFNQRGILQKNRWVRTGGNTYYVGGRGILQKNRWIKVNGNTYYVGGRGIRQRNRWIKVDHKTYYVNGKGVLQKNRWIKVGNNTYYVNGKGVLQKSCWIKVGNNTYYVDGKGVLQKNQWIKVGGNTYYVDGKGVLQKNQWIDGRYVGKDGVYDPDKKDLMVLKTKLESALRSYRGTWSVYVKNLETGQSFSINNRSMYAASLIKLYAMGAVYSRIAQGKISESSVSSTISSMITVSDNTSFNTIVRKVGLTYINQWCKENGYTGTNQGHGLSPSSNNYGLRNGSGSNVTSVVDCGKFLESVYRGTCVSESASKKMLGYLKRQQRRSKIPAGVPGGVVTANKTGETDSYTHDAAIVYSKNATYILVVMGSVPGGAWSSSGNITKISRLTYNYLNP